MKLYEIDEEIRRLWLKIIEQDGELTEDDVKEFNALESAKDDKVKAYGVIIRETLSQIEVIKSEIVRLNKLAKTMQNKADWLTNNLSGFMQQHEMQEFKSVEVNITFRPSEQLEILQGTNLAKKWLTIKTEPNKRAIKEFINSGGKVKGCSIIKKNNIQIK